MELAGLRGIDLLYCLLVVRLLDSLALTRTALDLSRGDSVTPSSPRKRGPYGFISPMVTAVTKISR